MNRQIRGPANAGPLISFYGDDLVHADRDVCMDGDTSAKTT
jgi:hypothetical protein